MHHYTYMLTVRRPMDARRLYIGVRSCKVQPEHDVKYLGSCRSMKAWMKLQGQDCVDKVILASWESREEALSHEILLHDCFDVGANPEFWNRAKQKSVGFDTTGTTHEGYNKGMTWTDEQKAAQSIRLKGKVTSDETKAKISAAHKGKKLPEEHRLKLVGRKVSEETLEKLRESHLGQVAWNKGKAWSEEVKQKLSKAKQGKPSWNKGRAWTEEQRAALSAAAKTRKHDRLRNQKGQYS